MQASFEREFEYDPDWVNQQVTKIDEGLLQGYSLSELVASKNYSQNTYRRWKALPLVSD